MDLFRNFAKFATYDPRDKDQNRAFGEIAKRDFQNAERFVLPLNGRILDNGGDSLGQEMRLPYPSITLEFESEYNPDIGWDDLGAQMEKMSFANNIFSHQIVFAEQALDGTITVQLASKFRPGGQNAGRWTLWPFKMSFSNKLGADLDVVANITPTRMSGMAAYKDHTEEENKALAPAVGLTILKPAFKAVAELLEALGCSNVKAEKKPNKKRLAGRRSGELPYDDYHELIVYTSRGANERSESISGGAKRREHLRRGHIRRYQSGLKIWVQAHVVNAGAAGKVTKHYKVK